MSFAKNIGKNIGKNISKILSGKYSQKSLNHTKQSATDALKTTSKKEIQKIAEAAGDLTGCKITSRITKISRSSSQNNSETIKNKHDKEIPKEIYISRRKTENYWISKMEWNINGISKNNNFFRSIFMTKN